MCLFVLFVLFLLPVVCVLYCYLSICVAMVDAHKVEQGPRVCPRLMVVLTQTPFVWAICIFLLDHMGKYFYNGPRMCPWLMVGLTQTLFVWAICIFLGGSQG